MSSSSVPPHYRNERLAYWYFRLNGFLSIENFIVHPDTGRDQRTDADLLAVRFAHRAENLERPMVDDPRVASCSTFVNVILAEVKTGQCALNGPWSNRESNNLQRVLRAIGCVPESAIEDACEKLYGQGRWCDSVVTIRLFALGEWKNESLLIPPTQQLTWSEVINFCVERFRSYELQKSSVGQWPDDGRELKRRALGSDPEVEIRRLFKLRVERLSDNGT